MARKSGLPAVQRPVEALHYALGGERQNLVLTPAVLAHFTRYRQSGFLAAEAGGQLFASYQEREIVVEAATGPYPKDRRSRFRFTPDRAQEQRDIDRFFAERLHFLGNWQTHPKRVPSPSTTDLANTKNRFTLSDHSLQAFVCVIVGLDEFPQGLFVALVDSHHVNQLVLCPSSSGAVRRVR